MMDMEYLTTELKLADGFCNAVSLEDQLPMI